MGWSFLDILGNRQEESGVWIMADVYLKEDSLLRDYRKLSQEYKNKAGRYIKNLLRLQRAEKDVYGKLRLAGEPVAADEEGMAYCSFCGKSQQEAFRLIAAGRDDDMVYICDGCVRICGEIIDEEEAERSPEGKEM